MATDRLTQVIGKRTRLRTVVANRWRGFQPTPRSREALPNRDGTIPLPRIAAPTPEQVARYTRREEKRELLASPNYRGLKLALERKIGATLDFSDLPPDEQALKAGRPVARLVTIGRPGREPQGFATGFLVHPRLLLTNWHVLPTAQEADGVGAQFLYERVHDGVRAGLTFELDRGAFFLNDEALDYAVVAVRPRSTTGAALEQFEFLPLIAAKGKILKGDPVNIIQHPDGRPKQYATVNNRLLDLRDDGFLLYETDTLEGSSGSPVYNRHWEVIGLHHSGVPLIENGKLVLVDGRRVALDAEVADRDVQWVANEGIRVSALVDSLKRQRPTGAGQSALLRELLDKTEDPVTWIESASPAVPGAGNSTLAETGGGGVGNCIQMTGPVTMHVHCGPGGAALPAAPTAAPPPPAAPASPPAEFREKALRFDEDYDSRNALGYKSDFLATWKVPLPTINSARRARLAPLKRGNAIWVLAYYHYSLVMSTKRRLVIWAACNVDYSRKARKYTKSRKEYGGENWRLDPRVAVDAPDLQLEDAHFYAPATNIDRGHIVRREDAAWGGTAREAEFGNSDTYHWTNCTPQHEAFNQANQSGLWGQFEEHIQNEVKALNGRMTVIAGPVLSADDPEHGYDDEHLIQVPMEFWKVVLCTAKESGKTRRFAYGFVFDQSEPVERLGYERMDMADYEMYQLPIAQISKRTGVDFDASVLAADVMKNVLGPESIRGTRVKRIGSLESIVLR
jgi:endonuclease G